MVSFRFFRRWFWRLVFAAGYLPQMMLSAMSHAKRWQFMQSRNEANGVLAFENRPAFAEGARLRNLRRKLQAGDSDGFCSTLKETDIRLQSSDSAFSAEMTSSLLSRSILLLLEDLSNQESNLERALTLAARFRSTSREPVTALYPLAAELARRERTDVTSIGVYREFLTCSGASVNSETRRLVEAALVRAIEQTDLYDFRGACVERL